jgi:uncharacterized protein YrrD
MTDLGAPISFATLQQGAPVLSMQGEQVGTVHVVVADRDADVFDALVIQKGDGLRVAVPDEVKGIYESGVVLRLGTKACSNLPKPEQEPALVRAGVSEAEAPGLRDRVRRVWEQVSGRS